MRILGRAALPCAAVFAFVVSSLSGPAEPASTKAAPAPASASSRSAAPLLRSLSLRDRIAQLIVVRGYGDYPNSADPEYRRFLHWIRDEHVGGFIVAGRIRNGNV